MLYVGAVESRGAYVRPNQVTRMTNAQADKASLEERLAWAKASMAKESHNIPGRWYAVDTRGTPSVMKRLRTAWSRPAPS
jgi:hypothetical protein